MKEESSKPYLFGPMDDEDAWFCFNYFSLQLTQNSIKRCIDSDIEFRSEYRFNFDKKSNADEKSWNVDVTIANPVEITNNMVISIG